MIHDSSGKVYCIDTLVAGMKEFLSCFLIDDEKVVLLDPGPPCVAEEVLKSVREVTDDVDFIALSHIHVDHAGASHILVEEFDARILIHPKAVKHLINPEKLWKSSLQALGDVADIYGKPEPIDESRIIPVEDFRPINLGNERIIPLYTPGHAVHHIAYFLERSGLMFSGESIGMFLRGRIIPTSPIPPLTMADVLKTLERIEQLFPKRLGFCHFGFSEPDRYIEEVKEKMRKWIEIARGANNIDEFDEKLLQEDEDYRYLTEYYSRLKNHAGLIFSYPYRTVLGGILSLAKDL